MVRQSPTCRYNMYCTPMRYRLQRLHENIVHGDRVLATITVYTALWW